MEGKRREILCVKQRERERIIRRPRKEVKLLEQKTTKEQQPKPDNIKTQRTESISYFPRSVMHTR